MTTAPPGTAEITRASLGRRLARGLGFLAGVAFACPLAYIGVVLGGSWGLQLFELVGAKRNEHLALIAGSVLTGGIGLFLAYGVAIGLTRLLEKAFRHLLGRGGAEPEDQPAGPRP